MTRGSLSCRDLIRHGPGIIVVRRTDTGCCCSVATETSLFDEVPLFFRRHTIWHLIFQGLSLHVCMHVVFWYWHEIVSRSIGFVYLRLTIYSSLSADQSWHMLILASNMVFPVLMTTFLKWYHITVHHGTIGVGVTASDNLRYVLGHYLVSICGLSNILHFE